MQYRLLRSLLFRLPPETAHAVGLWALSLFDCCPQWASLFCGPSPTSGAPTQLGPFLLNHPIGLAAGFDKDATAVAGCAALGFSFLEFGTVTPLPQQANEGIVLQRLPLQQSLLNRLGFPNRGVEALATKLRSLERRPDVPIGVNIGKNRFTADVDAARDYLTCAKALGRLADYLTINISSPNTAGLRQLARPEFILQLLDQARTANSHPYYFVKLSPDMEDSHYIECVDAIHSAGAGLIATNTTLRYPDAWNIPPGSGGLSGPPLLTRSSQLIRRARERHGAGLPLIGCGGINSAQSLAQHLDAGADAVQLYTGLVYGGPRLVGHLAKTARRA